MSYTRKTRDIWDVEQYTGPQYGWEVVTAEDRRKDALARLREYRENQPDYPVRLRPRRERIEQVSAL